MNIISSSLFDPISILFFASGLILGLFVVAIVILIGIKKGKTESKRYATKVDRMDSEKLELLIKDHKKNFKLTVKEDRSHCFKILEDELYEMLKEISSYYFPESKMPMLEITIDEALNMCDEIADAIDSLTDRFILKKVKDVRIERLYSTFVKKPQTEGNYPVPVDAEEEKPRKWLGKMVDKAKIKFLDLVKKAGSKITSKAKDAVLEIICVELIGIAGSKMEAVYSSKSFDAEPPKKNKKQRKVEKNEE